MIIILLVLSLHISGLLLSFSERKYQILDIQSDRKGDSILIEQLCYYFAAFLLMIAWGYISTH